MTKRTYDAAWRKVRLLVLERDGHRCQLRCSPKCKGVANEVDHRVSVSDGGARLNPTNLTAACKSCNISKRNREVAARARGVRADQAGKTPVRRAPKSHAEMTQAEYLADTGFDWPAPSGGWPPS